MSLNEKAVTISTVTGFIGTVIVWLILSLAGCISIPATNASMSMRNETLTEGAPQACAHGLQTVHDRETEQNTLNSDGFRLMIWNGMKNSADDWEKDFLLHSRDSDLIIMQEAYLTENLRRVLMSGNYLWDMSVSYRLLSKEAGVLTASKVDPDFLCTERSTEPLLRTPKSALVTRYPLSGAEGKLLVVNIHSINFTLDTDDFSYQLQRLAPMVLRHKGPIIFAGDFNTWSDERVAIVEKLIRSMKLQEVTFNEDNRSTFFGHNVDHIYYRGLEYSEAKVYPVITSDHNPMIVTFRLADDQYALW